MEKISINIVDIDGEKYTFQINLDLNLSLMDAVRDAGFPMGNCGGMALCASCHCYIESSHSLNKKELEEESMLDQLQNTIPEKSRLICQIPMDKSLDGIIIRIVRD